MVRASHPVRACRKDVDYALGLDPYRGDARGPAAALARVTGNSGGSSALWRISSRPSRSRSVGQCDRHPSTQKGPDQCLPHQHAHETDRAPPRSGGKPHASTEYDRSYQIVHPAGFAGANRVQLGCRSNAVPPRVEQSIRSTRTPPPGMPLRQTNNRPSAERSRDCRCDRREPFAQRLPDSAMRTVHLTLSWPREAGGFRLVRACRPRAPRLTSFRPSPSPRWAPFFGFPGFCFPRIPQAGPSRNAARHGQERRGGPLLANEPEQPGSKATRQVTDGHAEQP
jgi:hypothetical protein